MIAGTYILFIASSASAGPIFQFIGNGASNTVFQYSCPIKNFLISLDNLNEDNSSFTIPSAKGNDVPGIEPKLAFAGMWVMHSADVTAFDKAGKQFQGLLIPLFAGSLLIGLSGLTRRLVNRQPLAHHEKTPVKVKVTYEKTLWAESNGLM